MLKNPRHEKFARLVAAGQTVTAAYKKAGFSCTAGAKQSAHRLLGKPGISQRVAQIQREINSQLTQRLIAQKNVRLANIQERWTDLEEIRRERAAAPEHQNIPGGKTGFVILRKKTVGAGGDVEVIDEAAIDYGHLRAFDDLEHRAAEETGQLVKTTRIIRCFDDLTNEELENLTK